MVEHPGRCEGPITCKRCLEVRLNRLRVRDEPPNGSPTWVDYATSHQHTGGPCWQCVARKRALEEHASLQAENKGLIRVVDNYSHEHHQDCLWPLRPGSHEPQEDYPCSCGLIEALTDISKD